MERHSLLQLLHNGFGRVAIGWVEGGIVTVGATAITDASVTVGTGKTGMEAQFLHPRAKQAFKI